MPETDKALTPEERARAIRQLTLPCCNVLRLRDGLVADYRVYMDISLVYE